MKSARDGPLGAPMNTYNKPGGRDDLALFRFRIEVIA